MEKNTWCSKTTPLAEMTTVAGGVATPPKKNCSTANNARQLNSAQPNTWGSTANKRRVPPSKLCSGKDFKKLFHLSEVDLPFFTDRY